jgi:hypothetical protein
MLYSGVWRRVALKNRYFGGTYWLHLQGDKTLILPSSQRICTSRRTEKRASCNGTSTAVSIRYSGVIVDCPLFRQMCHWLSSHRRSRWRIEGKMRTRVTRHHIPEDNILQMDHWFISNSNHGFLRLFYDYVVLFMQWLHDGVYSHWLAETCFTDALCWKGGNRK